MNTETFGYLKPGGAVYNPERPDYFRVFEITVNKYITKWENAEEVKKRFGFLDPSACTLRSDHPVPAAAGPGAENSGFF